VNKRYIQISISILFYISLLLIVSFITSFPKFDFSGLFKMGVKFVDWLYSSFFIDFSFTLLRVILGFIIALFLGVLTGILTGKYFFEFKGVISGLNYLRAITPVALAPIFLIILGVSEFSKILLVSWGAFFPIWISTHIGIRALNLDLVISSKLNGLTGFKAFTNFYLPAAISSSYSGMRVAIGISYILVFISESLGANYGVGYRLGNYYDTIQTPQMMNALIVLGIMGLFSDKIFTYIYNYYFPWKNIKRINEDNN